MFGIPSQVVEFQYLCFFCGGWLQSPTLGAHTHTHAHGCDVIVHGWAWVGMGGHGCDILSWVGMGGHGGGIRFMHPCIQLQIGVKLLGCRDYANQEALRVEANDT
jgi:hypothetical protein